MDWTTCSQLVQFKTSPVFIVQPDDLYAINFNCVERSDRDDET